jgi:hypothetical protein
MKPGETLNPDDLVYELDNLRELMEVVRDILHEMNYVKPDGSRNAELHRVAALNWIGLDHVSALVAGSRHFDIPGTYARVSEEAETC